jgi:hypothetical protein
VQSRLAALARLRAELGIRLRPADAVERSPLLSATGIPPLDDVLGGGLPRGGVIEALGTGRTSLAMGLAAGLTGRGRLVAWIDPMEAFDARSARRAGVDFARLLWVRPGTLRLALGAVGIILSGGGFELVVLDRVGARERLSESACAQLARRVDRSAACLLLLEDQTEAAGHSSLTLRLSRARPGAERSLGDKVAACAEIVRWKHAKARSGAIPHALLELDLPCLLEEA